MLWFPQTSESPPIEDHSLTPDSPFAAMVYALGLLSHLLFASLALARPGSGFGGGLAKRLERRRGHPNIPVNSGLVRHHNSSEYQEILSSNWAGGVIESAPYSAPATSV